MSNLKKLTEIGKESFTPPVNIKDTFDEFFSNTLSFEDLGLKNKQYKFYRTNSIIGLENFNDRSYMIDDEEVTIPESLSDLYDFIVNNHTKRDTEKNLSVKFNPDFKGNTLYSAIGDRYKGLDCKYIVPLFYYKEKGKHREGVTVYEFDLIVLGAVYLGPGSKHGKIALFPLGPEDKERNYFKDFELKELWGFYKWFQPDFKHTPEDLIKDFTAMMDKVAKVVGQLGNKLVQAFHAVKRKLKED